MPRIKTGVDESPRRADGSLANRLANELRSGRESGQPIVYEQVFPSDRLRITVIWDEWDRLPFEERTDVILRAYDQAEGRGYRDRIALASGLTVPEAHAAGMLPVQVITALRRGDPVTLEECRQAMIEEGASKLLGSDTVQLRFATVEEAEAARKRLIQRLPNSDPVWLISKELGKVEDFTQM